MNKVWKKTIKKNVEYLFLIINAKKKKLRRETKQKKKQIFLTI